ncbi:MAG: signal transduction histidine kinase [Mariniblastus sp.]
MVVLIAALLALFAVRVAMRITIENEAKSLLCEELTELELAIIELHPNQSKINEEFERKILSHAQHGWFAKLVEGEQTIWESGNFPKDSAELTAIPSNPDFAFTQTKERLLVTHQLQTPEINTKVIILGEPTEFIRNDIWQLTKIMLLIGGGLLLVAPIGGFFLARHATQPVRQIIATTRSLNPSNLHSRLEIRGTGDELDQISTEINSFVDQIAKYINSQREFVANAAHELRSPITAIQTSVEVTLEMSRTPAVYQEELETVSEQCQQLRHLVNQLLELAESDTTNHIVNFHAVDLGQLIAKSVNVFSGVAEEKEITITPNLQAHVRVHGDESKLRQVVNNLIDNAIKFSPPGGKVEIELTSTDMISRLTFRDHGPGVPQDQLDKIFDRFFQVDQSRQRTIRQGNGLGLSICQSIIELHGGTIHATNQPKGLSVEIQFPAFPV